MARISDDPGLLTLEDKMRLMTKFELASKSETELCGLLREAFNALAASEPNSHQRRNVLATIENIQTTLHLYKARPNRNSLDE